MGLRLIGSLTRIVIYEDVDLPLSEFLPQLASGWAASLNNPILYETKRFTGTAKWRRRFFAFPMWVFECLDRALFGWSESNRMLERGNAQDTWHHTWWIGDASCSPCLTNLLSAGTDIAWVPHRAYARGSYQSAWSRPPYSRLMVIALVSPSHGRWQMPSGCPSCKFRPPRISDYINVWTKLLFFKKRPYGTVCFFLEIGELRRKILKRHE